MNKSSAIISAILLWSLPIQIAFSTTIDQSIKQYYIQHAYKLNIAKQEQLFSRLYRISGDKQYLHAVVGYFYLLYYDYKIALQQAHNPQAHQHELVLLLDTERQIRSIQRQ